MSRPIEPTPPVIGEDADRLLESLADVASPEEIARRTEAARTFLADVKRPKSRPWSEVKAKGRTPERIAELDREVAAEVARIEASANLAP